MITPLSLDTPIAGKYEGGIFPLYQRIPQDAALLPSDIADLVRHYIGWGLRFGIRADVAFAQMLYETGNLRFGGNVIPDQNNFCGLKTADSSGFASFATIQRGVIAHYAHLTAYCFPEHVRFECSKDFDPRHPDKHWNWASTIAGLSGHWSPQPDYADNMIRRWNA